MLSFFSYLHRLSDFIIAHFFGVFQDARGKEVKYSADAECEIISLRKLWNISLRSMWNEIRPSHLRSKYFTAKLFHLAKPNFTRRRRISLKKAHLRCRCAFFWLVLTKKMPIILFRLFLYRAIICLVFYLLLHTPRQKLHLIDFRLFEVEILGCFRQGNNQKQVLPSAIHFQHLFQKTLSAR